MIGSQRVEFAQRNVFLHLALGIHSATKRLDRVLARYGRSTGSPGHRVTPHDDELIAFVLGLVSFRDRARSVLSSARRPQVPVPAPAGLPPGGLLR
jgi:hypothetical protein